MQAKGRQLVITWAVTRKDIVVLEICDTMQPADGNDSKDVSACLKYYLAPPPSEYAIRVRVTHSGLELMAI